MKYAHPKRQGFKVSACKGQAVACEARTSAVHAHAAQVLDLRKA